MELIPHEPARDWQTADLRIRRWYHQREEILAQMHRLHLLMSSPSAEKTTLPGALNRFCQQLIDYVSMGHFVIYVQLIRPTRLTSSSTLIQLYHTIATTTDSVLEFNASLEQCRCRLPVEGLGIQLDRLGTQLHTRFALEDTLVSLMEAYSPWFSQLAC